MGVQGLWELLAPVGRRVSVETLAGKKLAIDASIWMIQFMKAMHDERGEMVRNAHLLGFFRRICKLLFLRAKPVFVFDGGTPALKRRTVAARRRHRENARAKIRKTAEKLLLNHLKSKKLEELAGEIKKSKSGVNDELKANQIASSNSDSPIFGKFSCPGQNSEVLDRSINQESLDKLLAASIAAEEEGNLGGNEPVITENVNYEEQDEDDEDKVMLFPVNSGNIDPAVLASLPPSMQLDLLDQMREKLMAENRQKYQKIKKVPAKFSELQIQSYLKTVAFRREINEVQKCASGRGVGGLQTSRIASEANREYIFSSSFTGDKLKLTPTSTEKNGSMVNHEMKMPAAQNASSYKLFMSPSKPTVDMSSSVDTREHTPDVETYLDERGRVRVSRVRGLGIHMTRDLQRNLDLMKEHEQVLVMKDMGKISEPVCDDPAFLKEQYQTNGTSNLSLLKDKSSHYTSTLLASKGIYEEIGDDIGNSSTIPVKETAIEVTFSEDETGSKAMVDGFFMKLVSENTTAGLFSESIPLEEKIDDTDSESLWEDGVVGEQSSSFKNYGDQENQLSFVEDKDNEEEEVLWEEDSSLVSLSVESTKTLSCGTMEEDADLKEAIRRSLDDINSLQYSTANPFGVDTQTVVSGQSSFISDKSDLNIDVLVPRAHLQTASMGLLKEERSYKSNSHQSVAPHNEYLHTSTVVGCPLDRESILDGYKETLTVCNNVGVSLDSIEQPVCQSSLQNQNNPSNLLLEPNLDKTDDHALECMKIDCEPTCSTLDFGQGDTLNDSVTIHPNYTSEIRSSTCSSSSEALGSRLFKVTSTEKIAGCVGGLQELADNSTYKGPGEGLSVRDQGSILKDNKCEASEADLHDEISLLKQERTYLGIEQRKLERNAESASSEMFAECQELLQMFGLPYIIAPMEAEAQCAYMEMTKLVDGIVTDDSDVFLFGARNVFKNIFDDRKYVETYFMKDIENELGLSRDKLIHIALLLGSDYTEGVSGIGIVNAIEVINAFPEKDGLLKFKNWVESPDPSILGLHGSQYGGSLSKSSSITNGNATYVMETNIQCSASMESVLIGDKSSDNTDVDVQVKKVFMDKHRNVSKNWHFPPSFPSESVVTAYISPQIDESTEPFAWGKPDLPLLRKMCWENFGWPTQKADELLVPVLREYNKHETQLRIEAFYSFNERFAKIRSQRIKKAVKGIAGIGSSGLTDIADGESNSNLKRGTSSKKSSKASESKSPLPHLSPESSKLGGGSEKTEQMGNAKVSGRGRGKRKRNESLNEDTIESTSVDVSSTSATQRSNQPPEVLPEMRRSVRRRKQVNYAEDDTEITTLSTPDKAADAAPIEHIKVTSQDYLHSGGGFCLEENEIQEQSFPATIPTALSFDQSNDVRVLPVDNEKCSSHLLNLEISQDLDRGSIGQGDVSKGHRGAAEEAIAVPDDLHGEQDKADVSGKGLLSAMPSLKRKRRIR